MRVSPYIPDAIRQRDAIFRFSLNDNFDPSLNFPNIWCTYLLKFAVIGCFINFQKLKNRVALSNRGRFFNATFSFEIQKCFFFLYSVQFACDTYSIKCTFFGFSLFLLFITNGFS